MAAEVTFPLTADHLRKRVMQLRALMDQGEFEPTEERSLLEAIFDEDELEWLSENNERFAEALERIEDDYITLDEASTALQRSQDAIDAHLVVARVDEAIDNGDLDDDDAGDDGDGDDGDDVDDDIDEALDDADDDADDGEEE